MVVHPDSDQVPRDWPYSGYSHESYLFRIRDFHPLWYAFPDISTTNMIYNSYMRVLQPPALLLHSKSSILSVILTVKEGRGLGSSDFARRYYRNLFWFLFLGVLRWFNSPSIASLYYIFIQQCVDITLHRLPYSVINGSTLVCSSPSLFAAYHDLPRLMVPRHPSIALARLTILSYPITKTLSLLYLKIFMSKNLLFK